MRRQILALVIAMVPVSLTVPALAHDREHKHWPPYVIEKVCEPGFHYCAVRMDYAPGQHAGLAGPGSYWYRHAYHPHRHHRHHARHHGGSRHAAWCRSHYRTYDRHSDTFAGKGYHRYRCNSPY